MTKHIAILRGINVGGKRKILMADLKQLFKDLNFSDVTTYIQSGNVIFSSKKSEDTLSLANKIEKSISKNYDCTVPVIVRTADEIENAILKNPFIKGEETNIERLHLTEKETEKLEKIKTYNYSPDLFEIIDRDVFVYCSGKYHNSKLTNNFFENKLKISATTRNWKTVLKLSQLSKTEQKA
jgi:uncharacterized protein (DUF1697 family)